MSEWLKEHAWKACVGVILLPWASGKPLSDMTLSNLIKGLGIAAVPHGFRSSFWDWAAERTNTPREVVEVALAHTVQTPPRRPTPAVISLSVAAT